MSALDLNAIERTLRDEIDDDVIVSVEADAAQPGLTIAADRMTEVALTLRDSCGFDRLLNVSGIDHEGYDVNGKGKHRKIAQYGEDGMVQPVTEPGTGDLGVTYHLQNLDTKALLVLKVRIGRETPQVASISGVWPTALWGERETFDMYGIEFTGHPDLRRLLMPEDWEGYPLRKDYEMPARYHDVPLEGLPLAVREVQQADTPTAGGDAE